MIRHFAVVCLAGLTIPATAPDSTVAAASGAPSVASGVILVQQDFDVLTELSMVVDLGAIVPAEVDPATTSVVITSHGSISDPIELQDAEDGRPGVAIDTVTIPGASLPRSEDGSTTITVPIEIGTRTPDALRLPRQGLYPIVVAVRVAGRTVAELTTFVNRLAPSDPDGDSNDQTEDVLQVSLVGTVRSAPTTQADGRVIDPNAVSELTRLIELATASPGPITVTVPPELLQALSTTQPELIEALRTALEGDELLASPYVEFEPSSATSADADETFTSLLREGENALAATVPTTVSTRAAWMSADAITVDAASLLRDLGIRLLIITRDLYDETPGNIGSFTDPSKFVTTELSDGSTMPVAVTEPDIAGRLAAPGEGVEAQAIAIAARLLAWHAQFSAAPGALGRRTIVLATPDFGLPDPALAVRVMELLTATPAIEPITLTDAAASTDTIITDRPVVIELPASAGADIGDRIRLVNDLTLQTISTGSMLTGDDPRLTTWKTLLGVLPSTALDDRAAEAIARRLDADFTAIRSAVVPPQPYSFTLGGTTSAIGLRFRNDASTPITIRIRLTSPKLTFPDGVQTVQLEPGLITEVPVNVEARANGTTRVTLEVLTPEGESLVGQPIQLTARVNALTGLGQVVTLAALALLATWWLHHWRSSRRTTRNGRTTTRHPSSDPGDVTPRGIDAPAAEALTGDPTEKVPW